MKKMYILGFASLLSTATFAQHKARLVLNSARETKVATTRATGTRTLTGGITSNNNYVPGTTMDLIFTLITDNTDGEYADSLAITFPAGFTVNSSTANPFPTDDNSGGAEALNGVSGQTISWGSNVGNTDNYGGIYAGAPGQSFDINVTVGAGVSGTQTLTFFAKGDEYPGTVGDPNGDMAGTISVMQASAADVQALAAYLPSGCSLANEQVQLILKNNGTLPATGFDVRYIINGGTPVVETYTGTVAAGDTVLYTFTTLANMSTAGIYNLTAVTTIAGDGNVSNDTAMYVGESISSSSIPYVTGFESTPATDLMGWTVLDNDGTGYTFGLSPTGHTGSQSIWAFENNIDGPSNDWAFSTCIDFNAGTNYRLTYWTRLTTGYAGSLGVSIGASSDVAGMTQTIKPLTSLTANSTWTVDSVDFMAPGAGTYYVGLNAVNTDATNTISIRVDDFSIRVVPTATGINEAAANSEFSIYPSPSTGVFNINVVAANTQLEVYDLVGKRIYAVAELTKGTHTMDLSGYANGAYFVKTISASKVATQKIIISK